MRRYWVLSQALAAILLLNLPAFAAGDFTITSSPASATVDSGGSTTFKVTASPTGGFTGYVNLSASFSPATTDVSVSFAKNPLYPYTASYYDYPDGTSMTVTANGMARGAFTITVTGTSGALTHSTSVTLQVVATSTSTTTTTSTTSTTTSSSSTTTSASATKSITSTSSTTSATSSTTISSSTMTTTVTTTSTIPTTTTASASATSTTTNTRPPPGDEVTGLNPAIIGAGGVVGIAIIAVAVALLRRRGGGS